MTHEPKDPACNDQRFMNIHIYKVYYVNWNFEKQPLVSGGLVICEILFNDFGYMETRKMETCCGGPGSDNVSQCSPYSDNRRSLRSVTKFHHFDSHNLPSNLAVWKGLQSNNQVHYNGGSSMHCYGTRFGGKSATEITVRRNTWEDQRNVRIDHQRGRATSCCEDDILSTVGDLGHQLRSRSHKWMPSSFLVTNTENDSHLRFGHISQGSNSEPQPARTSRDSDIHFNIDGDKKLNLISSRKKRLTAEEKLIEDNKAYYKLEMKNNKLRSSYYFSGSRHITDMGQTFSKETVSPLPTLLKDSGPVNSTVGSKEHKAFGNRKFSEDGSSDGCKLRSSRKVEEININDHNLDRDDSGDKKCDLSKDNTELQKSFHELKYNKRAIDDADLKADHKVNTCRKICDHKSQLKKFNSEKNSPPKESSEYRKSLKDRLEAKGNLDNKVKHNTLVSGSRRIRLSELSRLSNEAENFMFGEPVRKESSDESSEDEVFQKGKLLKKDETFDDKEKIKRNTCNSRECWNKKSEEKDVDIPNCCSCVKVEDSSCDASNTIHCDESSMGSVDTCSIGSNSENSRRRRKRRTQAEAFIHDNLDYYKFEIPGSRLRFQGSILPHTPTLMNHAPSGCGINQDNTLSDDRNSDFNKENNCISSQLDVSTKIDSKSPETRENAASPQDNPPNETETVHSKVDPKIKDEDCSGPAVRDNVGVLQFSFEAVPHNEPWYQTYQRQDEGEEIYLSTAGDATYWKPFLLPYEMPPSELFGGSLNSPVYNRAGTVMRRKKRTNRFAHLVDDKNPRKSPRCHASTLAILSDLMHFRKRKDPDKNKEDESLNSVSEDDDPNRDDSSSVSTTKQSSVAESVGESSTDLKELAKRIDEMLSYPSNDNITTRLPDSSKVSSEACTEKAKTKPIRSGVRKSVKTHRQKIVSNVEQCSWKELDGGVDFDPFIAEQLAHDAANYKYCLPKPSIRSRGGPLIDVVTLLDGFSDCACTEEVGFNGKECVNCGSEVISSSNLVETSCNGSEYEASSTCETVVYSDAPESKLTLPGRKRKRKKNRTGWPVGKKRIYKKVGKTSSFTNKGSVVSILAKQKSNGVGALSASGINRVSAVEMCSKAAVSEHVKEIDLSNIVNKLDESVLCKSCETLEKLSSKDELENISLPADSVSIEKQLDKSLDVVSSSVVTDQQKLEKHNRLLRTGSLDSSTQCSQLQPCVRVKKISNISDYIYVPSGVSNNRRLRSASSSSLTIPPIKKDLSDECVKELNRRSSRKKTPTKFTDNWESWLPPSRR